MTHIRNRSLVVAFALVASLSSPVALACEESGTKDAKKDEAKTAKSLPKCCQKKAHDGATCEKDKAAAPADGKTTPKDKKTEAAPAPGTAGMVVSRDEESGGYRLPTAAERRELEGSLREALSRSDEGLTVEVRPDGSKHVDLQGRFMDMVLVRKGKDGKVESTCVHDAREAAAFIAGETPAGLEEK
jgi:hypothetical protein